LIELSNVSDPLIAGLDDGTRIWNSDHAERAGSAPRRVEIPGPAQISSPSTTSKSLLVRGSGLSATESRSGRVLGIRRIRALPLNRQAPALAPVTIRPFPWDRRQRSAFRRSAVSRSL